MHHTGAVRRLERTGKAHAECEDVGARHRRRASKPITDRAAGFFPTDDVGHARLGPAVAVHGNDVRMTHELGQRGLLGLEPLLESRPVTSRVEQLHHDGAPGRDVPHPKCRV